VDIRSGKLGDNEAPGEVWELRRVQGSFRRGHLAGRLAAVIAQDLDGGSLAIE
jgi:hypothetical protein